MRSFAAKRSQRTVEGMTYLNDSMQAVVIIACERHADGIVEKVNETEEGNWFVMPSSKGCRVGYWPHVSGAHSSGGCAVFGFAESLALASVLREFACVNSDGSLCPDCVAYEWGIRQSHIVEATRDPVCGKTVSCDNSVTANHKDEMFCFCSAGCRDAFFGDPERYLQRVNAPSKSEVSDSASVRKERIPV
jgi:YHS domain-containing protein